MFSIDSSSLPDLLITTNSNFVCAGDSALICAPQGASSFMWNTGQTSQCIYVTNAGNYYVTAMSEGCVAESNHVAVNFYPASPVSIFVRGDTLTANNAMGYQWYLNGNVIEGADDIMWVALEPGQYTVETIDTNGCYTQSLPVTIQSTGIESGAPIYFSVYPNPLKNGNWIVSTSGKIGALKIFDAIGRKVFETTLSQKYTLLPFTPATGVYICHFTLDGKDLIQRIIKL